MRIAICDDQPDCLRSTFSAIKDCMRSMDIVIDLFKDGSSFLKAFTKKPYDLVFLDIEMPEIDGITLAKKLRHLHRDVPIVFLTSHIEYALEGYEVNALRYLTKPVNPQKLNEVLNFVSERMLEQRILWVKNDMGEQKILIKDILYMESQNQNVIICTKTGDFSIRYNLGDYEKELEQDGFFRIHRGYLVSLRYIKSVGKHEVSLSNNTILPTSRTKEKELKDALFQYIRKEAI